MFGKVREVPQNETTPFHPRSPYGVAKVYGHFITVNYRESYGMYAVLGHPLQSRVAAPRPGVRDPQDHRRRGADQARAGQPSCALGNLDAQRDWGFAGDYVRAMWLMLQQAEPTDFVVATGERTRSARSARSPSATSGWTTSKYVVVDPELYRPAEVDHLVGDASEPDRSRLDAGGRFPRA